MARTDVLVVEGRVAGIGAEERAFNAEARLLLDLDVHQVWRVHPPELLLGWESELLAGDRAHPRLLGELRLVAPGLRVGARVTVLARKRDGAWWIDELDVRREPEPRRRPLVPRGDTPVRRTPTDA